MTQLTSKILSVLLLLWVLTAALSCPLHRKIHLGPRSRLDSHEHESRPTLHKRNIRLPKGFECPPDVGDIDCYHELMALWMRLLMQQ